MFRQLLMLAACGFVAIGNEWAVAQMPAVKHSRLGVDLLRLKTGERVYGFSLGTTNNQEVRFAVDRKWLQRTHPAIHEMQIRSEQLRYEQSREDLLRRIREWKATRERAATDLDRDLVSYLEQERQSIERQAVGVPDTTFLELLVPKDEISELKLALAPNRKVAGLAYQHGLEKVVVTPATLLRKQLVAEGVDVQAEQIDLSEEVSSPTGYSEREWAAKMAIMEYYHRAPLEYQGTGTMLFKKGDDVDPNEVMQQMMLGGIGGGNMNSIMQLGAELGLPEFQQFKTKSSTGDWWRRLAREAEQDGFIGFRATRMEQSMVSPDVVVEGHFFAKSATGEWFEVARFRGTANTNNQNADRVQRIRQDPQVKNAIDMLSTIIPGGGAQLDLALRHGAAAEQALEEANGMFDQFLSTHLRNLSGPPIGLPE